MFVFVEASFLLTSSRKSYTVWIHLSSHASYMLLPSHHPWLDNSNYTWRKVQVMKLYNLLQFYASSVHFFSYYPVLKQLQSCCSLNVREQIHIDVHIVCVPKIFHCKLLFLPSDVKLDNMPSCIATGSLCFRCCTMYTRDADVQKHETRHLQDKMSWTT
jgi:hypothetical protein